MLSPDKLHAVPYKCMYGYILFSAGYTKIIINIPSRATQNFQITKCVLCLLWLFFRRIWVSSPKPSITSSFSCWHCQSISEHSAVIQPFFRGVLGVRPAQSIPDVPQHELWCKREERPGLFYLVHRWCIVFVFRDPVAAHRLVLQLWNQFNRRVCESGVQLILACLESKLIPRFWLHRRRV